MNKEQREWWWEYETKLAGASSKMFHASVIPAILTKQEEMMLEKALGALKDITATCRSMEVGHYQPTKCMCPSRMEAWISSHLSSFKDTKNI